MPKVSYSFRTGLDDVGASNPSDPRWKELRDLLDEISKSRAVQGFTPTETATFVFSFKEPLFRRLREDVRDARILADQIWGATELLDAFGLYTTEVFLKTREDLIRRAQEDMLELSTPVVKLWDGHSGAATDRHAGQRSHAGGDGNASGSDC